MAGCARDGGNRDGFVLVRVDGGETRRIEDRGDSNGSVSVACGGPRGKSRNVHQNPAAAPMATESGRTAWGQPQRKLVCVSSWRAAQGESQARSAPTKCGSSGSQVGLLDRRRASRANCRRSLT